MHAIDGCGREEAAVRSLGNRDGPRIHRERCLLARGPRCRPVGVYYLEVTRGSPKPGRRWRLEFPVALTAVLEIAAAGAVRWRFLPDRHRSAVRFKVGSGEGV